MQMQDMNQMAGMDKMSDSVTKMSETCMAMMEKDNWRNRWSLAVFGAASFGLSWI